MNTSHTDLNTAISALLQQHALPVAETQSHPQVLKLMYPTVASLLGESSLASLNLVYDRYCPSGYQETNRYGEQFPDFLALQYRPLRQNCSENGQTIAALATIEYQLYSLYYADCLPLHQLKAARLEDASEPVDVDFS